VGSYLAEYHTETLGRKKLLLPDPTGTHYYEPGIETESGLVEKYESLSIVKFSAAILISKQGRIFIRPFL
jgi:hypothetical protein